MEPVKRPSDAAGLTNIYTHLGLFFAKLKKEGVFKFGQYYDVIKSASTSKRVETRPPIFVIFVLQLKKII